ncbi:MAG TPA: hypothetical protein DCX06_03625, partial [Opitutae bacterium]|nr:hypothetical protein [Opitutae bacterium]
PEIYPIFKKGRIAASYTQGDFDGDGDFDLVVANPSEAEVVLFLKEGQRYAAPKHFPSFSSISSIVSGRFYDQKASQLVMVSAEEKTVGESVLGERGRLIFPKVLDFKAGDPVVCEALDLDRDGFDELAIVSEVQGDYTLSVVRPLDRKQVRSGWEILLSLDLEGVKRKPTSIRSVDVFAEGSTGLMIFIPREAPLFFASKPGQSDQLFEVAKESAIRQNLLKDSQPSQVSFFDVTGNGQNELIVGRKGYARALALVEDDFVMVDQFNARQGEDEVSAVVPLFDSGAVSQLIFYISGANEFQLLERGDDEVFRYARSETVGQINLSGWSNLKSDRGASDSIFYGDSQFWYLPAEAQRWSKSTQGSYETELEDVHYTDVQVTDFNADGALEIVAVDGQKHVVEVLSRDGRDWSSLMYWEVFEQNMHYQGRTGGKLEPRQTVIADLTGDGRLDFAFLIHDRILFYPQD